MEEITEGYNLVVGHPMGMPMMHIVYSDKNLIEEYKNAVINQNKFFTWVGGSFEMRYVLGVFKL
ncbi:hypothetical protein [Aquibacillus saliphilus]|uniref:hypothetical protein n=1 Tax=Aquibacillus saliphilus TaxID=1909422 RepID=UPI001CF0324A|nr:hypothetical protein [Aquibacillus saliphilus]